MQGVKQGILQTISESYVGIMESEAPRDATRWFEAGAAVSPTRQALVVS